MNEDQKKSLELVKEIAAKFSEEFIAKNIEGIRKYGGGLHKKNTLPQAKQEVNDLVSYLYHHELQDKALIEAVDIVLATYPCNTTAMERLKTAIAPFHNNQD